MAGIFRKMIQGGMLTTNIIISLLMLLIYFIPNIPPHLIWLFHLLPLGFPILLLAELAFLVIWLLTKPRFSLVPVLTLVLSYKLLVSFVGFHFASPKQTDRQILNVTSWNVHMFGFFVNNAMLDPVMVKYAASLRSDIFCAQELVFSQDNGSPMTLENLKKRLGYRYVFAGNDSSFGVHSNVKSQEAKKYHPFCLAIFSKYPIIASKKIQPLPEYNHTFIWADIKAGKDTLRIFNVHLQSLNFVKTDYEFIEKIDEQNVDAVSGKGRNILTKMTQAGLQRAIQAQAVREEVMKSPYPVIVCGDLNDVPNSYAHQLMQQELTDAFSHKGLGIGRTFRFLAPTLRLDYIFFTPTLFLRSIRVEESELSDHKPLTANFELQAIR